MSRTSTDPGNDWRQRATVSVPEAGKILNIGRGLAYEAAKSGQLPTLAFGKRRVVPTAVLRRMLDGEQPANSRQSGG